MIQKGDLIYFRAGQSLRFRVLNDDTTALDALINKNVTKDMHAFLFEKKSTTVSTSDIIAQCIYSYRLEYTINKYFMRVAIVIDARSHDKLLIMSVNVEPEILIMNFSAFNE